MGRKFDIRCFMVILCSKPFFVFGAAGYARVSLSPYTMVNFGKKTINEASGKLSSLPTRLTHETKISVQRKHPDFRDSK